MKRRVDDPMLLALKIEEGSMSQGMKGTWR